jgi:beta-xylosidase
MKYYCNPLNVEYKYQFNKEQDGSLKIAREAADSSMIQYKGKYYIFASMTLGVYVSEDMAVWEYHKLADNLPLYDYAPDVRVIGDYVYFSASKRSENCNFYRTKDIINGPYEEIPGTFPFWDPNLFIDDDGRVYFFWGCANVTPIYGVELNPAYMTPIGETKELIFGNDKENGFERVGEDHAAPLTEEEIEAKVQGMLAAMGMKEENMPPEQLAVLRAYMSNNPYIEGAWLDKHNGKYYLQYACPGTQYNVYGDGLYESDKPLGPYHLALNNPYSYKPGGFMPGAGHGSTMKDKHHNLWHAATMRIRPSRLWYR